MKLYKLLKKYKYVIIAIICILLFVFFNNNKELFTTEVNKIYLIQSVWQLGDNIFNIPLVNYLTEKGNKVILLCSNTHENNIKYIYNDNSNVNVFKIKNNYAVSSIIDRNTNGLATIKKNIKLPQYDVLIRDKFMSIYPDNNFVGLNYIENYDYFGFSRDILKTHFNVRTTNKSKELYNKIKNDKYVFYEEKASSGIVFNIEDVLKKLKLNKEEYICISPNKNLYDKDHKYFNTANQYLFKENDINLIDYKTLIENANYNILSDTSIHALALFLDTKYDNNYYISRINRHENFKGFIEFMDKKHSFKYLYLN